MTTASSPQSKTSQIPVLISGAGPVGTMAAIMLTRLGVPCRLIERDATVSTMSKALSLHARTLEILDQTGLIDRFLHQGHPITNFNVYFNGVRSLFPGLANSISHYNYALFLEQIKTTSILHGELEDRGLKIDRGWELMDTTVIEDINGKSWVETTIRRALDGNNSRVTESKVVGEVELDAEQADKEYEMEVVRSEYLIAADGGKSVVRHKVNIPFLGRTLENNVVLFDGRIETDLNLDEITVVNGVNNQTMNIFPLSNGNVRIMIDGSDLDPTQPLTDAAFEKLCQSAATPAKLLVKSHSWLAYYRVNERQAEHFSYKNRIFLAGDAAHVHSPAGGQGMNLGLQDAYNLTWKMALVLHGLSTPKLLETYEGERAPVAGNVIKMSSNMFAMGFSRSLLYRALRKTITTFASVLIRFIAVPAETVSMLTINYTENRINQTHKTQQKPVAAYQVGQRAHDGSLLPILVGGKTSEETVRLHQLMDGPGTFHVLVFMADMLSNTVSTTHKQKDRQGIALTDEAQLKYNVQHYLTAWRSEWHYGSLPQQGLGQDQQFSASKMDRALFKVHVIAALPEQLFGSNFKDPSRIQSDVLANMEVDEGKLYLDESRVLHERYGFLPVKAGSGGIVVVRPDSHVGYRVQGASLSAWQDVDHYFESIFDMTF
ncbi:hypothetical protein EDD11_008510 [Mortierella claussenii]|nr:hypothetical protein EDD11_008510 [Mortierella claussenii]